MKAHQRVIREQKAEEYRNEVTPVADIDTAIIQETSRDVAKKIILEYEWLGGMGNATEYYGIFFDGVCGGVVCFGFPSCSATRAQYHPLDSVVGTGYGVSVGQLVRGACVYWAHPHSASKLISTACKLYALKHPDKKIILAYSDEEAGEIGTVYQACNWYYIGKTNPKGRAAAYVINGTSYDPRDALKKFKSLARSHLSTIDPKYYKVKRTAKHQYLYWIGSKAGKRWWLKQILQQPYPKRAV